MGSIKSKGSYQTFIKGIDGCFKLSIKSVFSVYNVVVSIIVLSGLVGWLLPKLIGYDDWSWWPQVPIASIVIFYCILYLIGCCWMFFGKEEMEVLEGNITYYRVLFGVKFNKWSVKLENTQNWRVDVKLPDDFYFGKSIWILLIKSMYGHNDLKAVFAMKGGKILFEYNGKIFRFGNALSQREAEDIIEMISR